MSSDWERGYGAGFTAGMKAQRLQLQQDDFSMIHDFMRGKSIEDPLFPKKLPKKRKKLSAYNRFVKECAKKPRFKYKSGKKKGMLNMRAIGQAWRKKRK